MNGVLSGKMNFRSNVLVDLMTLLNFRVRFGLRIGSFHQVEKNILVFGCSRIVNLNLKGYHDHNVE